MPQMPAASSSIVSYDLQGIGQEDLLALVSVQGLVNRIEPQIYTYSSGYSDGLLALYRKTGIVKSEEKASDVFDLLRRYREYYAGIVVYDPGRRFTVNLATNIAGVENRVIIAPSLLGRFLSEVDRSIDILDLRDMDFPTSDAAFDWYRDNIFPKQNHNMLAVAKDVYMWDVFRDYPIACNVPVFWLPGENDEDYSEEDVENVRWLYANTPANIPVFGFWPGLDNGKDVGYNEFFGTKLASEYGKYTIVCTWVGSYSYHSGVQVGNRPYRQVKARAKKFREYDPGKKYVALVMVESGDAPGYYQFDGFFPRQWDDPQRGEVPVSYGISMSLKYLMPGVMRHLYDTATENDYFFCPISGAGYCYPFLGLCDSTADRSKCLEEYFGLTAENMKALDMDMLALYTHPDRVRWSSADSALVREFIEPLPEIKSIISGMHRTGYTPRESNGFLDNGRTTVHHVMTHWAWEDWDLFRSGEAADSVAAAFLADEIRRGCDGASFVTAMFYSWHYGPRRLAIVQDILEKENYEFVTLDEYDRLFRESRKQKEALQASADLNLIPHSPPASRDIVKFTFYPGIPQDEVLAIVSLQGLVNRENPVIFTYAPNANYPDGTQKLYEKDGYITSVEECQDIMGLMKRFSDCYDGAVVYDPAKRYTVNLASNIAGAGKRVILSPEMLDEYREKVDPDIDVFDLRDLDFENEHAAFLWYRDNIFPKQDHRMLGVVKDSYMYDVIRDYLIACNSPTFWLYGKDDEGAYPENLADVTWIMENTPSGIPVFGSWIGLDGDRYVGYNEYFGTQFGSWYGKYTLGTTWVGGFSYHSGVDIGDYEYRQTKVRAKKFREYDPTKKYVALVMVDSGDAPAYYVYDGLFPRQWDDPCRGQVPLSYGLALSMRQLMPGVMKHLYETATENDYFFAAVGGLGYSYTLLGLCDSTATPEADYHEFYRLTDVNMKALDMDMMMIYTFSGYTRWSHSDSLKIEKHIAAMPHLTSLISGLHRTGYSPAEGNGFIGGSNVTVHHVMNHWSDEHDWELFRSGEAGDAPSVDHLEAELRRNAETADFITTMFYSWHYGPRRLKMLTDRMEKDGFVFVTMNEFDWLYRQSLLQKDKKE